ncbi:MAG: T9SS type A sorting domain-containing protein [Anaerolineae bacterium]|nr:T9SS type A sorting domain-containing protein [Anaerolineae bacterium]
MPNGINPPIASGFACLPAILDTISVAKIATNRIPRTISFSGYEWWVKASVGQVGPGSNYFSDNMENVWVDGQGQLHLKITRRNGTWYCAEVVLTQSLGYGRYIFKTASKIGQINENAVLGLFTWDNDGCNAFHREIDIEFSRWGVVTDPNGQYVVQPWDRTGNRNRWTIPTSIGLSTHSFIWQSDNISFLSAEGHQSVAQPDSILYTWNYTGTNIPEPDTENPRINLWLLNGIPPSDNMEVEVVIADFNYDTITSIDEKDEMRPMQYFLSQNYPNPFNPDTRIRYELPSTEKVKIAVYNVNGQLIRILFEGLQSAGRYVALWDGKNENGYQAASGIYLVRMEVGTFQTVKKMVLTR